jgi:hypothetical protein
MIHDREHQMKMKMGTKPGGRLGGWTIIRRMGEWVELRVASPGGSGSRGAAVSASDIIHRPHGGPRTRVGTGPKVTLCCFPWLRVNERRLLSEKVVHVVLISSLSEQIETQRLCMSNANMSSRKSLKRISKYRNTGTLSCRKERRYMIFVTTSSST